MDREPEIFETIIHKPSGVMVPKNTGHLNLYQRNIELMLAVIDILKLEKYSDWSEMKRQFSRDHVKALYEHMAWLWPVDTDVSQLLSYEENQLRALYVGDMRPETVRQSIIRHSLYCDQILVVNPFMNPWCVAEQYNPLVHPEQYLEDTLRWLHFTIQLMPWIESGHVVLIPDPGDFDYKLRTSTWDQAKERNLKYPKDVRDKIFMNDKDKEEEMWRFFLSMPDSALKQNLKEMKPDFTEKELGEMIEYINEKRDQHPHIPTNPNENLESSLHHYSSGFNLEMSLYVAQMTGSYLYTDIPFRWYEIKSTETEDEWSSVSRGFQTLDFNFLDNVSVEFANEMRKEGRLSGFRDYLRSTYHDVTNGKNLDERNIIAYQDRLKHEYNITKNDWAQIDKDLARWALGRDGVGAIISAGLDWQLSAAGFALEAVNQLFQSRSKRKEFRKNVPLSVFMDLEKTKKTRRK